jgi:hypothetical protein
MNVTGASVSDASFPGSATGTTVTLQSGAYSVAETLDPAYAVTYSDDCSGTIAVGQDLTCTVTNDDKPGTLTVITDVVNDDGGTQGPAAFTTQVAGTDVSDDSFPGANGEGTTVTLDAGAYAVTEAFDKGYAVAYSDGCTGSVGNGETRTCTITNDDVAPRLTVVKEVVNDDGGTKTAGDFTMTVSAVGIADGDRSFSGASGAGRTLTVRPGAFSVGEVQTPGYAKATAGDCSGTIALGETRTCTITDRDVAPRLNVVVAVVNDDGGTKQPADFTITATGTDISAGSFAGLAAPGTALTLDAGGYAVTQTPPAGYVASYSPQCAGTIAIGEERTCTVTNDDATRPPGPVAQPPVAAATPVRCVSRRVVRVSIKRRYRGALRSTVVTLDGRRVATLRGGRSNALISLAGRPRSTVTVRLTMRTKAGRRIVDTRRYRLCVPPARG